MNNFQRISLARPKLHKTPEEAVYHGVVLGQRNGAYNTVDLTNEDGSLKSTAFKYASTDTKIQVLKHLKGK